MEELHGHKILGYIKKLPTTTIKADVISAVVKEFGENVRYYNCSNSGYTAEELITFFEEKGKVIFNESGYTYDREAGCKH